MDDYSFYNRVNEIYIFAIGKITQFLNQFWDFRVFHRFVKQCPVVGIN